MPTPPPTVQDAVETPSSSVDGPARPGSKRLWTVGTLTYTSAGLFTLFFMLLAGDFAWSMRERSVGPMAQWYLDSLKVPNLLFGLLLTSFPALLGLVLGPIISVKSDRHRGRWGRRIPYLLVTTPMAAVGMIGLAVTPPLARWLHGLGLPGHPFGAWLHRTLADGPAGAWFLSVIENEMVVSLVCFMVFWAAFEVASIAGQAVFGGLINDVVPHDMLGRFYGLFRAVSLIDGMIFNYWIMGYVPTHFTLILISVGVFYGLAFMWVCLRVKEGGYPPPPASPAGGRGRVDEVKLYFRESFSRPYYLFVFVMLMMSNLAFMPVNAFSVRYAESLGMSMKVYGHCLALTYLCSLCLAYFLGAMADRFHPMRVSMGALAGYLVVSAAGMLWATTADRFAVVFVIHGVLAGCYFSSAASLMQRLFPQSKFAQFASAAGIVLALGNMTLIPAVGTFVDLAGRVYRHTFGVGFVLTLVALVAAWQVYVRFMRLGGPKGYVAPE